MVLKPETRIPCSFLIVRVSEAKIAKKKNLGNEREVQFL